MGQVIKFIPTSELAEKALPYPNAAKHSVPQWYTEMPNLVKGEKVAGIHPEASNLSNYTLRGCQPFVDALTTGYTWELPTDVEVRKGNGGFNIRWMTPEINMVTQHDLEQAPGMPKPSHGYPAILKWDFPFIIKTPPGYSTLFTHPVNRHDLPFRTFSGVVDTDTYHLPVNFPFQMLEVDKEIYFIEKGTPIVQIIPIKREAWESQTEAYDPDWKYEAFKLKSVINKSYKRQWWHRKSFK